MKVENLQTLYGFNGFVTDSMVISNTCVKIHCHRDRRRSMVCPICGKKMGKNRTVIREVYDLPIGPISNVVMRVETVQGKCSKCKIYKTFLPDGIADGATATRRFQQYVCLLCRVMSPVDASKIFPFSDDTIRRWDQNILHEKFGKVDLENVRHLLIDEKSIGKHHHYITLVLNGETGELLYMNEGKGYDAIKPFFEQMTPKQRENIKTACMDRNASYPKAVKEFCPNAVVIYDKFHIVKNLNDAVDQVRRDETRKAEQDRRLIIKGERYNLFRLRETLTDEQCQRLDDLLKLNKPICAAYILKESFRQFWGYTNIKRASKFLSQWTMQAVEGGLKPLIRFGQGLLRDKAALLASLQYGFTNAAMERFNGTVSRVIARGFGYRNKSYLFLKLRQQSVKIPVYSSAFLR